MTDPSQPDTERLVGALMACLAPLTQILDHMARSPQSASVEGSAAVLQRLLTDTLGPMSERLGAEAVRVSTELLVEAADVIVEEIHLVPHVSERRLRGRRPYC
jgi:hypothetical protein